MQLLEKILVAVNVNETNPAQINVAKELALKFKSNLILMGVLPSDAQKSSVNNIITHYVEKDLNDIESDLQKSGIVVDKKLVYGSILEQIIIESEKENVNVILVPEKFGPLEEDHKVGVVVEKLVRKCHKPVWVVDTEGKQFPGDIVCSIDYSDASERALHNAIRMARHFKSKLYIVNVLEPLEEFYSPRFEIDYEKENKILEEDNKVRFDEFLKRFNFADIEFETSILKGTIYKELKEFILLNNIRLLFIGATGKKFFQRVLLGSVTELMVRYLPCSTVVTKSENIINLKMDSDISGIEKHYADAMKLEAEGLLEEAIEKLNMCLQINDLHFPTLNALAKFYKKTGNEEMAETYSKKMDEIVNRLWDKDVENEIRKRLK